MRLSKNQRGFGLLGIVMIVALVAIIALVGYRVYQAQQEPEPVTSQTPTPPAPEPEPIDPTADWERYTNRAGKYTLKHPVGWYEDTCDNDSDDLTLYLGPTEATRVLCGSEHGSQMMFVSTPAVPTDSEQELDSEYYSDIEREEVVVDGVTGHRNEGKLKAGDFGLPKNTLVINYFFLRPGRSYIASYVQAPSGDYAIDNLEAFELIVKETWDFTD